MPNNTQPSHLSHSEMSSTSNTQPSRLQHLNSPLSPARPRSATPTAPSSRLSNRTHGSATQTLTSPTSRPSSPGLVLRLRGSHNVQSGTVSATTTDDEATSSSASPNGRVKKRRQIQWAEDVIDNEGLGRKKSKVCCIYHKPRAVGESSSEEDSSSSDSDSGTNSDGSSGMKDGARPVGGARRRGRKGRSGKSHGHDHQHGDGDDCGTHSGRVRKPSPNAYEKMPKYNVKLLEQQPG